MKVPKLNMNKVENLQDHLARVFHVNWNHVTYNMRNGTHVFTVYQPMTGTAPKLPIATVSIVFDGATFVSTINLSPVQEVGILALAERCLIHE